MEQLEKEIIGYLTQAKDFLIEELPEFFNEALHYWFWENLIMTFFCIVILFIYGFGVKKFSQSYQNAKSSRDFEEDGYCAVGTILVIVGIMVLVIVGSIPNYILNCVKIKTAPKLYIYEKFIGK